MSNEELREKMGKQLELTASLTDLFFHRFPNLNVDELFELTEAVRVLTDRYSRIPQPEHSKEPERNYVSLVNGSGTHCKECGKRL